MSGASSPLTIVRVPAAPVTAAEAACDGLAALAETMTGIVLPRHKAPMLEARLTRRLRLLGLIGLADYLGLLRSPGGYDERRHFITAVTTKQSYFFREAHHFNHLRERVLPLLIDRARAGQRVRLWSAGTAMGQEAYSLAMLLCDLMPDAADRDIRILATDVDQLILEKAREGRFEQRAIAPIPRAFLQRFVKATPDGAHLSAQLKALVSFRELNLHAPWPMRHHFDVIMCRNVTIYFPAAQCERLQLRLRAAMAPGGWLYLGHAERLLGAASAAFSAVGRTTYRAVPHGVPLNGPECES